MFSFFKNIIFVNSYISFTVTYPYFIDCYLFIYYYNLSLYLSLVICFEFTVTIFKPLSYELWSNTIDVLNNIYIYIYIYKRDFCKYDSNYK